MSMNSCDLGGFKNGMEILYNFFIYRRIKHFDKRLFCIYNVCRIGTGTKAHENRLKLLIDSLIYKSDVLQVNNGKSYTLEVYMTGDKCFSN